MLEQASVGSLSDQVFCYHFSLLFHSFLQSASQSVRLSLSVSGFVLVDVVVFWGGGGGELENIRTFAHFVLFLFCYFQYLTPQKEIQLK